MDAPKASPTRIIETLPEEWRPIPNFEGVYEVSNHGRVRRLLGPNRGRPGKVLPEPRLLRPDYVNGYLKYRVSYSGRQVKKEYAHALVMAAFVGPRPDGYEIGHLDGHRDNPVLSNLAYVTQSENNAHKHVHGTMRAAAGPQAGTAKLTAEQVVEMRALRRQYGPYKLSMEKIARRFGLTRSTADKVCRGATYQNVR